MAVKGFESYERRVYTAQRATTLTRLKKNSHMRLVQLGDEFFIRVATSTGAYRVVFRDLGPTRVFTVPLSSTLYTDSQRWEEGED